MKIDEDFKFWGGVIGTIVALTVFAVVLDAVFSSGRLSCTRCGDSQKKEHVLVLHMKFGTQILDIPYCPKCFVKILDDPETLTWAGKGDE